MNILNEIFTDEKALVTALGILKSSTSSPTEKFFNACVALLTAELEDRLAALPPPEVPVTRSTGPMTDKDGNLLHPATRNPQTAVRANAEGFLIDAQGNLVDANGNRVAQGVKATL
jgi:hypothetical protein